jgi:hypothetical protein
MTKRLTLEEKLEKSNARLEDIKSSEEFKLIEKLKKGGYDVNSILEIAKASKRHNPNTDKPYEIASDHYKFIVFGDTHIGNKMYDGKIMSTIARVAKDENVDGLLCT